MRNAFSGNSSSGTLVSCRQSTSGACSTSRRSTSGMRRRTELMFQVAIEKGMFGIPGQRKVRQMAPTESQSRKLLTAAHRKNKPAAPGKARPMTSHNYRNEADSKVC
ncbi:hypothetical protein BQ8794_40265 [Mesorhizobium prunaredense]|uniref:Uncharacterized protein n=1 Tax=Mesorhizobium prunaredense TaxID=1631249 RepID=A0A1R3VCQ6_9HYPH|nr:hypothetical protein BQ8794_40265 [Mesorhizobium prunaredense]